MVEWFDSYIFRTLLSRKPGHVTCDEAMNNPTLYFPIATAHTISSASFKDIKKV